MKFYKLSGIGYPVKIHKFYILLFALCFYNIAYGQNQPITVSMKNQPLLKVFEIIEDQTEFSIAYNQTKLDVKQKVSANFVREAVSSVLNSVLNEQDSLTGKKVSILLSFLSRQRQKQPPTILLLPSSP